MSPRDGACDDDDFCWVGESDDDQREFDAFFRANDQRLRRLLRARGAPPDLVDELAPFSFMTVRRRWTRLRTGNPHGYLTTVAENERRKRIGPYLKDLADEQRAAITALCEVHVEPDAAETSSAREISSELIKLLDGLPPRQRQAVVLRHIAGLDVKETAQRMSVADGTVKGYTSRGLAALGDALKQHQSSSLSVRDGKDN